MNSSQLCLRRVRPCHLVSAQAQGTGLGPAVTPLIQSLCSHFTELAQLFTEGCELPVSEHLLSHKVGSELLAECCGCNLIAG